MINLVILINKFCYFSRFPTYCVSMAEFLKRENLNADQCQRNLGNVRTTEKCDDA